MSECSAEVFRRLGTAFATGGDRYDRLRPGYPDEAVTWLVGDTTPGGRVVDVGAGTGKLTDPLSARGFSVLAVDPSADMLAQLSRRLPSVGIQVGTGEDTGLGDHCADLVTFAQSWHWVEPTAGAAEAARILAMGGTVAMVWNFVDVRIDWVAELAETWHTLTGVEAIDATRHRPTLGSTFGEVETFTVDWADLMSTADLAALVTTRSYYLTAVPEEQQEIRRQVTNLLAQHFPDASAVALPYRSHCYRARRLG